MSLLSATDLILNNDNSVYHLALQPDDIADTILTVGDPGRVAEVSNHFDRIELKKQHRELVTHTGYIGNKRLTVLSTGMSTGNIDIVLNELDALVNIDFKTRQLKTHVTSLNIIRIGTTGAVQADIPIESHIMSRYAIGLDGALNFYHLPEDAATRQLHEKFIAEFEALPITPYVTAANEQLCNLFSKDFISGVTATCSGFYASQGRMLRAVPRLPGIVEKLSQFNCQPPITNLEMETAAIYGLGAILGHRCCSLNVVLANRMTKEFSTNPKRAVERLIATALSNIISDAG